MTIALLLLGAVIAVLICAAFLLALLTAMEQADAIAAQPARRRP